MRLERTEERPDAPRWQIAAVAIALLGAIVAAMLWARALGVGSAVIGEPGMFPYRGPIRSVSVLVHEPAKANLAGLQVVLADVVVRELRGEQVFLIGDDDRRVPVVLFGELTGRQRPGAVTLRAGQHVRIYGIVRLMRDAEEIADLDALSPREAAALEAHEIYVSALRVAPLPISEHERRVVPRVITAVAQLAEVADLEVLDAREVSLDRVRVLRVLGDHVFVVGDDRATVPVVLLGELTQRQGEQVVEVRAGDVVRIYGVVRRMRNLDEIEDVSMLTSDEAADLRGREIYVSALRVVPVAEEPSS